jgi:hypothetical protein
MPAKGFIWALQYGYMMYLWDLIGVLIEQVWESMKIHINVAINIFREAGFDV